MKCNSSKILAKIMVHRPRSLKKLHDTLKHSYCSWKFGRLIGKPKKSLSQKQKMLICLYFYLTVKRKAQLRGYLRRCKLLKFIIWRSLSPGTCLYWIIFTRESWTRYRWSLLPAKRSHTRLSHNTNLYMPNSNLSMVASSELWRCRNRQVVDLNISMCFWSATLIQWC